MLTLVRDSLLSYCPLSVRRIWRPESLPRTLRAATWGGLAQLLLAGLALILRLKSYLILRTHQLAPQAAGTNETGQTIIVGILLLEYLLLPVSLFLVYVAIEGAVRFAGGLLTGEIVPSLAVSLYFKGYELIRQNACSEAREEPADGLSGLSARGAHQDRFSQNKGRMEWKHHHWIEGAMV